jgi:hypothetical protein
MFVWCANSSAQIMQNSRPQQGATNTLSLDSAKNMTVCGQVCLREHKDFKIEKAEFSDLPTGVFAQYHIAKQKRYSYM